MFVISQDQIEGVNVGDVFAVEGKNYTLVKKTRTAISIRRYYWYDKLYDALYDTLYAKIFGRKGPTDDVDTRFIGRA
jgi:hypothetical protein